MYRTRQVRIKKGNRLRDYCVKACMDSATLYNRANFIIRQYATACRDWDLMKPLTKNQMEVWHMVRLVTRGTKHFPERRWLTYRQLDYILKATKDPAYRALPAQANQQVLKRIIRDYKSFFESMKVYRDHPDRFTGRPKLPGYKKKGTAVTAVFTNQICKIRDGRHICFPKTKGLLDIGKIPGDSRLKEVRIKPCHGDFYAEAVLEFSGDSACRQGKLAGLDGETLKKKLEESSPQEYRIAAIDPGVDNFCAVTNNFGAAPFLISGGTIKSENRYYNKQLARLRSEAMRCNKAVTTRRIRRLTDCRNRILKDLMHKASRKVADWAAANKVDLVVLGHNVFQKQGITLGHVNNQNFVQIPFGVFAGMLEYKLEDAGIAFLMIEESYTSKADYLAGDRIPVYKKGKQGEEKHAFSGKRITRGQYRHFDGTKSNADINGSANILRKVFPDQPGWGRGVVGTPYAVGIA